MKLQDLLSHIADNIDNGRDKGAYLFYKGGKFQGGLPDLSQHEYFSLAPRTHIVNGFTVPAPEVEMPEKNKDYYFCVLNSKRWHEYSYWTDSKDDLILLARGLVFLTGEAAIANAKAMLGINPYSEGEK